jgi:hypothetical protein
MAINFKDPRFQKQLLAANANRGNKALFSTADITKEWVDNQMRLSLQMERMGLRKYLAERDLKLDEQRLAFQQDVFKTQMKMKEDELFYGLVGGLGTSVFAALEGRRRRKEKEKTARMIR